MRRSDDRDESSVEPSQAGGVDVFGFVARFAPTLFLIALMALFAVVEPRFLSSINLFNVMRQVSITGLLAIGMTFVILTAGIDLSVGSLLAFAGLVAAAVAKGGLENRFTVGEGGVGYGWGLAALAAIAVGVGRRLYPGPGDHPAQGSPVRGDARRHVGLSRRGASVRRRRADLRLPAVVHLVGPGQDRPGADPGHHLSRRGRARPYHAALHPLRPAGLCGRRQPRGGAPLRPQRQPRHRQRLRHHGLLRRPWRLRAGGAAQFRRGGRREPATSSPSSPRW